MKFRRGPVQTFATLLTICLSFPALAVPVSAGVINARNDETAVAQTGGDEAFTPEMVQQAKGSGGGGGFGGGSSRSSSGFGGGSTTTSRGSGSSSSSGSGGGWGGSGFYGSGSTTPKASPTPKSYDEPRAQTRSADPERSKPADSYNPYASRANESTARRSAEPANSRSAEPVVAKSPVPSVRQDSGNKYDGSGMVPPRASEAKSTVPSGSSTASDAPKKGFWGGGWFSGKSQTPAQVAPAATPRGRDGTSEMYKAAPSVAAGAVIGSASSGASRVRLNPSQGGIGGTHAGAELSGVKKMNGNTFEGVNDRGDRIRFKENTDGSHRITSVVKNDSAGNKYTANYDASGRRTAFKSENLDGSAIKGSIRKDGTKRVTQTLSDGSRVVSDSRRGGFVEKNYSYMGRPITQRTYYNSVTHSTYVTHYTIDPYGYHVYSPSYHFAMGFYTGLVLATWHPLYYPYYSGWTWYPAPWIFHPYNPYAYYFTPYVYYSTPTDWITDYVIADTLNSYHENRLADQNANLQGQNSVLRSEVQQLQGQINQITVNAQANDAQLRQQLQDASAKAVLTQDVKNQISAQVRSEMEAHQNQSSVPMYSVLQDPKYLFIVSDEIEASYTDAATNETKACTLDEGDIFHLTKPFSVSGDQKQLAEVAVVTAKKSDDNCHAGTIVNLSVSDLQDMKNRLSERAEAGAKAMNEQQGKNGIPQVTSEQPTKRLDDSGGSSATVVQQLNAAQQTVNATAVNDQAGAQ